MSTARLVDGRQHVRHEGWLAETLVFALVAAFALAVLGVAIASIVGGA